MEKTPLTREDIYKRELDAIWLVIAKVGSLSECPFFNDPAESPSEKVRHLADECTYLAHETGAYIPEEELKAIMNRLSHDHSPHSDVLKHFTDPSVN